MCRDSPTARTLEGMPSPLRAAACVLAALLVLAAARGARADGGMWGSGHTRAPSPPKPPAPPFGCVCVGPLVGPQLWATEGASWAVGAELSIFVHERGDSPWGQGAFGQVLRYFGSHASTRWAGGYEIGGPVGVEIGAGVRSGERGTSLSAHLAPYASIGYAHVALRASPGTAPYGSEVMLVFALKLPLLWGEQKLM